MLRLDKSIHDALPFAPHLQEGTICGSHHGTLTIRSINVGEAACHGHDLISQSQPVSSSAFIEFNSQSKFTPRHSERSKSDLQDCLQNPCMCLCLQQLVDQVLRNLFCFWVCFFFFQSCASSQVNHAHPSKGTKRSHESERVCRSGVRLRKKQQARLRAANYSQLL